MEANINNNAEMARPLHPSVDPKLKRIVPQFGWGDEFIKQLDQSKPGTAVDFDRHGVFIKREGGLWDTLVRQAMMTETLTVDELPSAHPSCRCAVKYHMKPAERPKNKEPEEPEPLPTDESDGIINTGSRAETPVEEPELPTAHTSADTEWLRDGYDSAILHGNLSALTGFDTYQEVARQVEVELVGLETFDGIKIAGYKTHFIDRVIGDYNIRREPVEISDIKKTLLSDTSGVRDRVEANGLRSRNYISESCRVTINPDTRFLVQATPKKKGGIDVGKSIRKPEGRIAGFISRRIRWLNRKKRL